MNVYRNTPIDQFTGSQGLSVRSVNVCKANGIRTLGDLLNCTTEEIHGLRNCGAKSFAELDALRHRYNSAPADLFTDIMRRGLHSSFLRAKERLSPQQIFIVEKVMGSFGIDASTSGKFFDAPFIFIDSVCKADAAERGVIMSTMVQLFNLWKDEASGDPESVELLQSNIDYVEQLRARYEAEDIYTSLPPPLQKLLSRRYREAFGCLSVRTKNALPHLGNLKDAVPYIFGVKSLDSQKLKKVGARTMIEMQTFLSSNKNELLDIFTASKASEESWHSRIALMFSTDIAARFPFLTPEEVAHVSEIERNGSYLSPYYLLERYVMHSNTRPARVYARRYGIGVDDDRRHFADIGASLGLSGERVRQLLAARLPLSPELDALLKDSFDWLDGNVSGETNPRWVEEHRRAGLDISLQQFMALATAVKPEFTIIQLSPKASAWLVRRDILQGVNLMTTLRQISQSIEMRRTQSCTFDLMPFIYSDRSPDEFNPDVDALAEVYFECITRLYNNVEVTGATTFTVGPNKLDVIAALEDVLDGIGHAVSYNELCKAFDASNPGHLSDTRRQLRSYIFRSKRIAPVGRSGRYVMRHWHNVFAGTVTQCMAMELRKAGEPMTAEELHSKVSVFFPTTTINSINVFAYLDKGQSIVILPDHRYAPAGGAYDGQQDANRRVVPFGQRMEALKMFVGEHHRFPLLSDSDSVSLRRWLDNVRHGVVVLPANQRNELDEFLRDNGSLPSTSSQATFRHHVHSVMRHVCRHGALPTVSNGSADYHWLQRVRQTQSRYGDVRDTYRSNLSAFLTNFGYSI